MESYTCNVCFLEKPLKDFPSANTKLGHRKKCRACTAAYYREYYKAKPEQYKKHKGYVKENDKKYKKQISWHYGITPDQYNQMLDEQNGLCGICKLVPPYCVDHDHSCCPSGSKGCGSCVRGLLCRDCNLFIGHAKDNIATLQSAIDYLKPRSGTTKFPHSPVDMFDRFR